MDKDMVDLISELGLKGFLNNTLLIVLSDHGHRFTSVRNTLQGKLEERMPLMSLRFPPWFKTTYPQAFKNLEMNKDRLVTALDIHATLKHLLYLNTDVNNNAMDKIPGIHKKAVSLLHKIAINRDCASAGIETHWCACLNWSPTPIQSKLVNQAANHILNHINSLTDQYRTICTPFIIDKILKASVMAPRKDVLKFKKTVGPDGEEVDLGESSDLSEIWVQVQLQFQPGDALFDVTLKYDVFQKQFSMQGPSSISRISLYRGQADCISEDMRPYCYCTHDKLSSN